MNGEEVFAGVNAAAALLFYILSSDDSSEFDRKQTLLQRAIFHLLCVILTVLFKLPDFM